MMAYKLMLSAETKSSSTGFKLLADIVKDVRFIDGVKNGDLINSDYPELHTPHLNALFYGV